MRGVHTKFVRIRPSAPAAQPDGIAWEHAGPARILSLPTRAPPQSLAERTQPIFLTKSLNT